MDGWKLQGLLALGAFASAYWLLTLLHELVHIVAACLVGHLQALTASNLRSAAFSKSVRVAGASSSPLRASIIRHAGWVASVLFALRLSLCSTVVVPSAVVAAAWLTALDAISSDLFGFVTRSNDDDFHCGNFGLLLIDTEQRKRVFFVLQEMIRVTQMRGAQSGGVVTYVKKGAKGFQGVRSRVVNGKRTDLAQLVIAKLKRDQRFVTYEDGPRIYAGHTRFATTSKATLDGTHPHQWTPPEDMTVWRRSTDGRWDCKVESVENFISHNGDFDAFDICNVTHPLGLLLPWLEKVNASPCPTQADSAGVAGLMDVLRCQGVWFKAVRFGFLFGVHRDNLDYFIPTKAQFMAAASQCEEIFESLVNKDFSHPGINTFSSSALSLEEVDAIFTADVDGDGRVAYEELYDYYTKHFSQSLSDLEIRKKVDQIFLTFDINGDRELSRAELLAYDPMLRRALIQQLKVKWHAGVLGLDRHQAHRSAKISEQKFDSDLMSIIETTVAAFFDQDLLQSVRMFMQYATGSFGICANSSLEAHRQVVIAARGQTMSVAMYPTSGVLLWASEQAATKAAVNMLGDMDYSFHDGNSNAVRIDLDDLGGEVCLIDWGEGAASMAPGSADLAVTPVMEGRVSITLAQEVGMARAFPERLLELSGNENVRPLPRPVKDPVGSDIESIPRALQTISDSMTGTNSVPAFYFAKELIRRLKTYDDRSHDGSVDLVLTGCEVSLWLSEQFASDIKQVLPRLNVKTFSSNKLLGVLGQDFAMPQIGHQLPEDPYQFKNSIVIIVSHSGGTFAPLAVSNLLQGLTPHLFVLTSEYDTQIGKQLRHLRPPFSTEIGMHPAEPCTISVAATQHLLTEILLYTMKKVQIEGLESVAGGCYTLQDIRILEDLNHKNIPALREIIGLNEYGAKSYTDTSNHLRRLGDYWSRHVLEGVYSWIMVFCYVMVTVVSGYPILTGIATAISPKIDRSSPEVWFSALAYWFAVLDGLIYVFSPQWCCLLLRIAQGRPLRHRMTARCIIIGDTPWVAQCVEAYLSKLFACSYSAAGISVYSANPSDHLVHRLTHRVLRGALLVCGRPDGRLMALTTAENAVCLSTSQASSIQSIGSTLESITIGHNPSKMGLCKDSCFLKSNRKDFFCEVALKRQLNLETIEDRSSGMLLGDYCNMRKRCLGVRHDGVNDAVEMLSITHRSRRASMEEIVKRRTKLGEGRAPGIPRSKTMTHLDVGERYYGELEYNSKKAELASKNESVDDYKQSEGQVLAMRLYEGRIASLQRAVSMFVLFHQLGKNVQDFWPRWSLGYLGYDMSRTHSIMRIATTASPVNGAEVRSRSMELEKRIKVKEAVPIIATLVKRKREYLRNLVSAKELRAEGSRSASNANTNGNEKPSRSDPRVVMAIPTPAVLNVQMPGKPESWIPDPCAKMESWISADLQREMD